MSYGLLGRTLGHSFSPQIHAQIADYDYDLFEVEPADITSFFEGGNWRGVNVTIPYKETVLPYCDEISEQAQRIGCVNTLVRRPDGTLFGTNTDYDGLSFALDNAGIVIRDKKCLVLGNGATSKTVCTVLADKGAREIVVFGRHDAVPYTEIPLHHDAEVIVNATPVGMYPNNGARLIDLDGFAHLEACFDVIYNPHRSQFLLDAERRGVITCDGLPMLVAQAVYADASNKVEIGFAFVVFNFHARAFDQQYRLASEGMHDEMVVELLCFFKTHGVPFFANGDRRKRFRAPKPIRSFYEFGGLANTPRMVFSTSSHLSEKPRCPTGASLLWRIPPCRRRSECPHRLR